MNRFLILTVAAILCHGFERSDAEEDRCKQSSEKAETVGAKVEISKLEKSLLRLRDEKDRPILTSIHPEFMGGLRKLFEVDSKNISKLEQFYGLLFYLAKYKTLAETFIKFKKDSVRDLLITGQVFSTSDVPNHISEVNLYWSSHFDRASYEVKFDQDEVRIPLNQGKGFASFREGLCQIAEQIVFYYGFQFNVQLTGKEHVFVSDFKNVDIFGKFGSRGSVNVDLNYVSILSVEFLTGSNLGTVKAKVSKREFQVNDHHWLLKVVTKFVTDKSTQPIDW